MGKVFAADVGTKIILDTGQDLSAATLTKIKAKVRGGTEVKTLDGTVVETTKIQHSKTAETLATAGVWTLQAYVEFTADKYWGEKVTLEVEAPIS